MRDSTQLAAQMRPIEFGALMERFFIAATKILTAGEAAIDKMVGDEVIAFYLPGLIGDRHNYRRNAVRAGIELLRATGHAEASGPWLPIGVGVHSGVAFVGSIGTERGTYEFAALGETMNLWGAARCRRRYGRSRDQQCDLAGRGWRSPGRASCPQSQGDRRACDGIRCAGRTRRLRSTVE